MSRDMFYEAENNFAHAEKTLKAFFNIIKKPFIFIFNKISDWADKTFNSENETTKIQLKRLPL